MRPGETPVPIPNTMVKPGAADGTMLETAWESRWLPNFGGLAQLGEHLPCKQGVESSNLLVSMPGVLRTPGESLKRRRLKGRAGVPEAGGHLENSTLKPILKYRKIGKTSEEAALRAAEERPQKTGPLATLGLKREGKPAPLRCRERGHARKSTGRMPWHWEPTKDVISCEQLRGGANIHRSGDI